MSPQHKRPLVLVHKCTECATFAFAPTSMIEEEIMEIDQVRLSFSKALRLNTEDKGKTKIDNEDSDYSSQSGHSSPEDSPVCRSDSPSPVGMPNTTTMSLPSDTAPVSHHPTVRFRSISESGNSHLKGILKRRPAIVRFVSQCDEESVDKILSSTNGDRITSSNEELEDPGDSEDSLRDRSHSSSKKTVRFNDRIQENVFRPNSSILGQRKKNQRKQQRKRKRTDSCDSNTENENEKEDKQEPEEKMDDEVMVINEQCNNGNEKIDPIPLEQKCSSVDDEEKIDTTESDQKEDEEVGEHNKVHANRVTKHHSDGTEKRQRAAAVLNDPRYSGFVLGNEKKQPRKQVRRNSSGDSGLADDEEEPVKATNQKRKGRKAGNGHKN